MTDKLFIFSDLIDHLTEWLNGVYRVLRNKYKWSPSEIDNLQFKRIVNIFHETVEDMENERNQNG